MIIFILGLRKAFEQLKAGDDSSLLEPWIQSQPLYKFRLSHIFFYLMQQLIVLIQNCPPLRSSEHEQVSLSLCPRSLERYNATNTERKQARSQTDPRRACFPVQPFVPFLAKPLIAYLRGLLGHITLRIYSISFIAFPSVILWRLALCHCRVITPRNNYDATRMQHCTPRCNRMRNSDSRVDR